MKKLALLMTLFVAGCGGSTAAVTVTETERAAPPQPEATDDDPKVGATQTDDQGLDLTVLKFQRAVRGPSYANMLLSQGPRSLDTHELARIEIKATNDGPESVSLWGFSLVDAAGRRYGEEPNRMFQPNALGEQLGPGDFLRGYTGFVIPKRAKIVGVHYASPMGDTLNWSLHERVSA